MNGELEIFTLVRLYRMKIYTKETTMEIPFYMNSSVSSVTNWLWFGLISHRINILLTVFFFFYLNHIYSCWYVYYCAISLQFLFVAYGVFGITRLCCCYISLQIFVISVHCFRILLCVLFGLLTIMCVIKKFDGRSPICAIQ